MSDGPSKLGPGAQPLDDIILGEDEVVPRPPVTTSLNPGSNRAPSPEPKNPAKKKKLTLRIPDDEVSRPDLAATPMGGMPIVNVEAGVDTPRQRMHAIVDVPPPPAFVTAAAGLDITRDPGWTPFAPMAIEDPIATPRNGAREEGMPVSSSDDIPVELEGEIEPEIETAPRLPQSLDSDDLEEGERQSDLPEIGLEDLVSVDSMPLQASEMVDPALGVLPRKPQGVSAASLMAAAPTPARSTPQAPPVVSAPPSSVGGSQPAPMIPGQSVPPIPKRQTGAVTSQVASAPPAVGLLAPPPMSDSAAHRKKTRPWWEELFNDDFIRTMAKVSDPQIATEVDFIEESLGCEAGAMILDMACGTGRHAVQLAARGYQVVGYDLSLAMLARASDEAQERKQKINFVQGDMRDMTFEETFDGIFSWNTSFGFFDEEKNAAVVAKVHRALKKGGQFLLDVVNRDYIVRQAPSLAWFEGDGCICMDEMQIDFIASRMRVKRTLMMDDGRTKEIEYSIRVYALHELGKLLHDNGFRVAEVSGRTGTPGVFFGCESPRTLILAEKR